MNSTRKGVNVTRKILAPARSGVQDEMQDLNTAQPDTVFLRAVVVRVIDDVSEINDELIQELQASLSNPQFLSKAPRNSIIARIISNGIDRKGGQAVLCYPFLPSHIAMPIKSGEQVWVIYESPAKGGLLPFWMWRIHEADYIEDANYTHGDRRFDRRNKLSTIEKSESSNNPYVPSFQNGGGTSASLSLKGQNDYETIVNEDPSYQRFTPESVPRFTKRPGDLALQGSNNTLIVLGEDRTGSSNYDEEKSRSGTIDIVAGRSRNEASPGDDPEGTSPRTIQNSRGNIETDKNPSLKGKTSNLNEGNPDFTSDAARVYVSMNTNPDDNLNLEFPDPFVGTIENVKGSSSVLLKADELRIVARSDSSSGIDGSVRIIKEGEDSSSRSSILMLPGGITQIDSEMIFVGRTGGSGPGPEGSEPYIKFSKYKEQITEVISIVEDLLNALNSAYAVPVAAPGIPHPGLNVGGIAANQAAAARLSALKLKIDEAQSKRIFGE